MLTFSVAPARRVTSAAVAGRPSPPSLLVVAAAIVLLAAVLPGSSIRAADSSRTEDSSRAEAHRRALAEWVALNHAPILDELTAFLRLPNVNADREGILANATVLEEMLQRRGATTRRLESGGGPYIYAHLPAAEPPADRPPTVVLFYAHYDGQPVDASRWTVGEPFRPTLTGSTDDPETRLYARSAADDKGPIVALLAAIDALRAAGFPPSVEAKFILDPEEEVGSPHLDAVLEQHADLLSADLLIFADGPVHQSGLPTVVFGTRGIVTVRLTVYGPRLALHSGHYGNWAPNPAEKLADLLASMKDGEGRATVAGFYDDVEPLGESETLALRQVPRVELGLMRDLLINRPDGGDRTLQELLNQPSLNVRGLASAWVGTEARTIVPSEATAEIDLRLVKNIDPMKQVDRLRNHVAARNFHVVEEEPDAETRRQFAHVVRLTHSTGTAAWRTSMDTPLSAAVIAAFRRATPDQVLLLPTLGGTVPMSQFESRLGVPIYGAPMVNPDNNQHSPDENLRLGNLWDGIVIYASLLRLPDLHTATAAVSR